MRFWCILCPPIAVLLCGRPIQALINFLLWLCLWIPGSIHAWGVVSDHKDDKRMNKFAKAQSKMNNG